MALHIPEDPVAVRFNVDRVALVGNSRVRLETIIAAFYRGDSPEQIADDFDVLSLAEVYAAIASYLSHREEWDAYVAQQDAAADAVRQKIEANAPEMLSLRVRLLARRVNR